MTALPKNSAAQQLIRWRTDPVAFVTEALQVQPQRWQQCALEALRDHDRLAIRSGHGVGKSALLAWIILWWLTTRYPSKVACTAPTAHQLYDVLWSELARWSRKLPDKFREQFEWKTDRFELKGAGSESFAVARTARKEQPEALQGFHSPNMLFLCDEASGIDDIIFEVGAGAMSTLGAKTVLAGNPTRTSGYFFDAFHRMRAHWHTMRVSCSDSDMVSPSFLKEMADKYGIDSNIYAVRVSGDFPRSEDDVIIPLHLVEAAIGRDVEPINDYKPLWGLDVARFGGDRSALAKRRNNRLLGPIKWWRGVDTMQLVGHVVREYMDTPDDERPSEILVDVIGLGAGVVDRLREMKLPCRGVNVAESPAVAGKFARQRDELWWRAREWFERRDVVMVDDIDLVSELTSLKYSLLSSGKLKAESKDDMKRRGLPSPDLADSFVLTFAGHPDLVPDMQARRIREVARRYRSKNRSWLAN